MITYSCASLPSWAQLSTDGVLTVSDAAPLGSTVLNLTATDGVTTWTRSVTIQVGAKPTQSQWFSVSTAAARRIAFKLSAESGPAKLQPVGIKFIMKMQGPPLPPPDIAQTIAFTLAAYSEETFSGGS